MGGIFGLDLERLADDRLPAVVEIDSPLPPVRLRGRLERQQFRSFSGVLSATVPATTVTAFGQLDLAAPGGPAFVALLGATFPEPGIQLGLGFALSGVGGVVGVNKAVNRDALIAAIADGTAGELLFPPDPVAAAKRVVPRLPALFPTVPGRTVVGPMFEISWGGRMVSLSAAVVAEVPDPVRLSLLGILRVAVPDPEVPLIQLKATFAGQYDSAEPSAFLMASLSGSHMAGVPLDGDVLVLSRGGPDPTFVLSAGGFHPAFAVPRGVPALHRLSMNLSPVPWIQLRCQAYFAITSNTLQFGAQLSLVAEIAGCGLRGQFGLDVLVHREPSLSFSARMRGSLSVEVFGESLVGVAFDLVLEGPAPWHAVGRGSIDLFLFSASFDFDERWGNPPPALPAPPADLRRRLEEAFARPEAWSALPPAGGDRIPVLLSPAANRQIGEGRRVHPHGGVVARQRVLPFGVDIERLGPSLVEPAEQWDVASASLGGEEADAGATTDGFAPGQFRRLTDDEQLAAPAYDTYRSGVRFVADTSEPDEDAFVTASLDWETKVVPDPNPTRMLDVLRFLRLEALVRAEKIAATVSLRDPSWWPTEMKLLVSHEPPVVAASTWAMTAASLPASPSATNGELRLLYAGLAGVRPVEAWEV
ncbi:hypothetical protein JCM4814A_82750 [Streptomyces phaeofaciens JCM 4814]|uniref:DUF6603 domain-containing protein n=1 Tax=Streptomyces phaeofaciens TaxID=68254 RepID=A0A918HPE6_9ACTN|nr:DUF6603 domain-containing protein [Streptomyces phaeofaciens]GGT90404.1 hypothetical protein GCM10010226_80750 [Streptomyces phaeofaciens]